MRPIGFPHIVSIQEPGIIGLSGFTFIMEGAGDEYVDLHKETAAFWEGLEHMRSNQNPNLAMATFIWAGPGMLLLLGWAVVAGAFRSMQWAKNKASQPDAAAGQIHGS